MWWGEISGRKWGEIRDADSFEKKGGRVKW